MAIHINRLFFFSTLIFNNKNQSSKNNENHFFFYCFACFIKGNHAIGAVRKFPTLPLNANGGGGVWIDPAGGVWRQTNSTSCTTKEPLPDYAQVTGQQTTQQQQQQQHHMPLPDYER